MDKPSKSVTKLQAETDRLARQAKRTKEQLDKVQHAADTLVEQAANHKTAKQRGATRRSRPGH